MSASHGLPGQCPLRLYALVVLFMLATSANGALQIEVTTGEVMEGDSDSVWYWLFVVALIGSGSCAAFPIALRVFPRVRFPTDRRAHCAWFPGLTFVNIRLLNGGLLSVPFIRRPKPNQKKRRLKRLLRLWSIVATARAAERAAKAAAFFAQTWSSWATGVKEWRRDNYRRYWQTVPPARKLFYLVIALLADGVFIAGLAPPSPSSDTLTTLTPSQLTVSPFMTHDGHSTHLLDHQKHMQEQQLAMLLALGPAHFEAGLAAADGG